MKAELGDENAGKLVSRIEVLLQEKGLDKLVVSLPAALDRIIQSLSSDERRSIAENGAIPARVTGLVTAEAENAKLQQRVASRSDELREGAKEQGIGAFSHSLLPLCAICPIKARARRDHPQATMESPGTLDGREQS